MILYSIYIEFKMRVHNLYMYVYGFVTNNLIVRIESGNMVALQYLTTNHIWNHYSSKYIDGYKCVLSTHLQYFTPSYFIVCFYQAGPFFAPQSFPVSLV